MAIQTRLVDYRHNDVDLRGLLAWDDEAAGPRPGILISHTWAGRGPFEDGKAVALAEQGYVAMALDMYGTGILGSSPEENAALMAPLVADRSLLQARINCALEVLRGQQEVESDKVVALGFCFGGLGVLDLARAGANVRGVVSGDGVFTPGDTPGQPVPAAVLCLDGYGDAVVPPDTVVALADELTAAGADWQIHAYGDTVHAFTNPAADDKAAGTAFSETANRRAWQSVADFLQEVCA